MTGPILVTGASGQVGSAISRLLEEQHPEAIVVAPGRSALDLCSPDSIRACVRQWKPQWIVSCGAYTAVDAAESDSQAAFAVNAHAPAVLAEEAARLRAGLIHLSTDYVFDGSSERPWTEKDATAPLNVYGASKLAGEQAIAAVAATASLPHVILRTSWVYSGGGKNFVRTMLRLLSTRTEALCIVADQHGAPTAATDLAQAILTILRSGENGTSAEKLLQNRSGIYHCAGSGETTWAGLAEAVGKYLRVEVGLQPPAIIPVETTAYPTPALRPRNSRLNCDLLLSTFGIRLPQWEESVLAVLRELALSDLPMLRTLESARA